MPDRELACPTCGRYFDGGFDLPDLIDGMRALQPALEDLNAAASPNVATVLVPAFPQASFPEPVGEGWWAADEPAPSPGPAADEHLPQVGGISDLPYADPDREQALDPRRDHDRHPDHDDVIDLRDPPTQPRPGRSWLRRRSRI